MAGQGVYEELFDLFAARRGALRNQCAQMTEAAQRFASQVHKMVGYPESTFQLPDDGGKLPWVQLFKIDESSGEMRPVDDCMLLDSFTSDGSINFAVGIGISASLHSFPKQYYSAAYRLMSRGGQHLLTEEWGDREEYLITDDPESFTPAVNRLLEELRTALTAEPWKAQHTTGAQIGFLADI